jgi:hypothetical protein
MYKSGTLYYWVEGSFIGGLIPKKANPYVHVSIPGQACKPNTETLDFTYVIAAVHTWLPVTMRNTRFWPSSACPCCLLPSSSAHWSGPHLGCMCLQPTWRFQDQLGTYPTWNCTVAASADAYDYYTGTSNFLRCGAATHNGPTEGYAATASGQLPADLLPCDKNSHSCHHAAPAGSRTPLCILGTPPPTSGPGSQLHAPAATSPSVRSTRQPSSARRHHRSHRHHHHPSTSCVSSQDADSR